MYTVRVYLVFFLIITYTLSCLSQSKDDSVYLIFNENSNEFCEIEDNSGKIINIEKFWKEDKRHYIDFHICNERFIFKKSIDKKKKKSIEYLSEVEIKDIEFLIKKHSDSKEFKHHVFKDIFIIEYLSDSEILIYRVNWNDKKLGVIE